MNRERYLVPISGNINSVEIRLLALTTLCEKHATSGLIYVPVMKTVKDSMLSQVLSESQMKTLIKGQSIKTKNGQDIYMCSTQTFKNHRKNQVVLALWASRDMIEKLENEPCCKAITVVQWTPEDTVFWEKDKKPKILSET